MRDAVLILALASFSLWLVLAGTVLVRKRARDLREARSRASRETLAHAIAHADTDELARLLADAIGDPRAQIDLIAVLDAGRETLGAASLDALSQAAGTAGIASVLTEQATARRPEHRGLAVLLAGSLGVDETLAMAQTLLADRDPDVRLAASAALARVETPAAASGLIRGLAERRLPPPRFIERLAKPWAAPTVADALVQSLDGVEFAGSDGLAPELFRSALARALGETADPLTLGAVVELFARGGEEERINAVRALGSFPAEDVTGLVLDVLDDPSWPVRAQAARSLGRLGDPAAAAALEGHLGDSAWWVRANAGRSLIELGDAGIAVLERARHSDDRFARDRANECLALARLAGGAA